MNLNEKVLTRADRMILGGALLTLALLHVLGTASPWSWLTLAVAVGVLVLGVWRLWQLFKEAAARRRGPASRA
ncbi:MAG: hypothetical protein E6H00_02025 [Bacillati bacterium ANGP1]|uniref:Uncharacterized protein n=1 Tax=Candidatus Segetimicrobium genomatis TaxID=2569760 RepID=A0A537KBH8_9BACT|nr:MAG: hypothetical protein E6H00_02025 [Terrabacteria group bacterium ANGP1]